MASDKGNVSTFRACLLKEVGITVAVLVPLIVGFAFLRAQVAAASERMIRAQQTFADQTNVINRLIVLRTQYDKFARSYLNVLRNVIPEKDSLINVSQEFQALAENDNLKFGFSFRGEDPASPAAPGAIHFSVNISGKTLNDITTYIKNVKGFHYLTTLDSVHISRTDTEVDCIIIGRVYYHNPENT